MLLIENGSGLGFSPVRMVILKVEDIESGLTAHLR